MKKIEMLKNIKKYKNKNLAVLVGAIIIIVSAILIMGLPLALSSWWAYMIQAIGIIIICWGFKPIKAQA